MDNRIGTAKVIAKCLPGLNMHHLLGIDRIHQGNVIGKDGALTRYAAHTQAIQRGKGVGAELNTRPNLTNLVRLFQQHHFNALASQRERSRCAANASPDDNCAHHFSHCFPPFGLRLRFCLVGFRAPRR